jgi:hypothetical protein
LAEVLLPEREFLDELERLVRLAEDRRIPLRAVGSVGIYYLVRHDPGARSLYLHRHGAKNDAPRFKDLDLASLEKRSAPLYRLLVKELGFAEDRETNALFGMHRSIYFHPKFSIDVFYDALRFSHEIRLAGRFPPGVTLSPEDLFLGKAQIHAVTPPDLADLAALVSAVPVSAMDSGYLAKLLGDDWGLWYDVRANLGKVLARLSEWERTANGPEASALARAALHASGFVEFLDRAPKSRRWEKRSIKGTAEPWFEEVDEIR